MDEEKFACPGHEGKCVFCKREYGYPRSVGKMPEINRITGERKVDHCCHPCKRNDKREKRFYERTSLG